MIFEGEESFGYDIGDVWNALHDTEVLTKALPGCKSMTATGNNSYVIALSLGVAAVRGEYEGTIKVTDVKAPSHYIIEGEGTGAPGFVKLRMDCRLERLDSGVLMKWKCDATVGGLIASIGGRVLSGVSKFMAQQFFKAFKDELARAGSSGEGGSPASPRPGLARPSPTSVNPPAKHRLARFWSRIWRRFSRQ